MRYIIFSREISRLITICHVTDQVAIGDDGDGMLASFALLNHHDPMDVVA